VPNAKVRLVDVSQGDTREATTNNEGLFFFNPLKNNALPGVTFQASTPVAPDMIARGKGRILFTSSIASIAAAVPRGLWRLGISAVVCGSHSQRNEDTGVTVTSLMPGPTETDFFRRAAMEDAKVGAPKETTRGCRGDGFKTLIEGKDHVIAGSFMNRLQGVAGGLMPETVSAEFHRKQSEPGSARK
jgi:short-subunit dehydrogenase